MTETGLLIAQAAFLVLLYLFVWSLVRSSSRDLQETQTVVVPTPASRGTEDVPDAVVPVTPMQEPVIADPTPAEAVLPEIPPIPDADADMLDAAALARAQRRPTGPALDLSVNIDPRLVVEESPSLAPGSEYRLEAGMTIGRSRSNGIPLSDQFVSHMHARVFPNGQFFFIEDLGSTNGTFLNGHKVEEPTQLKVRDLVSFGDTVLRYEE